VGGVSTTLIGSGRARPQIYASSFGYLQAPLNDSNEASPAINIVEHDMLGTTEASQSTLPEQTGTIIFSIRAQRRFMYMYPSQVGSFRGEGPRAAR